MVQRPMSSCKTCADLTLCSLARRTHTPRQRKFRINETELLQERDLSNRSITSSPNIQQIFNRIGTFKPKVFGIIQYGVFERNRVAMGLKETGPFFHSSMANNVLQGRICEIYKFGTTDDEYIDKKSQSSDTTP